MDCLLSCGPARPAGAPSCTLILSNRRKENGNRKPIEFLALLATIFLETGHLAGPVLDLGRHGGAQAAAQKRHFVSGVH